MRHGIFAVDPGGHTGVAWGIIDRKSRTVAKAMISREDAGSVTIEGPERGQIIDLYQFWTSFKRHCLGKGGVPPAELSLVFEDFVLRGGQHAGGRDGTTPERIIWGFEGYRLGKEGIFKEDIIFQMAGAASQFGTRPRLENWNAWIRGREHERSAWSHFAVRVSKLLL